MNDLLNKKCVTCEGGIMPFDVSEIHKYQKKVDGWSVKENQKKIYFLEKKFKFKNFINSQNFINKVSEISEISRGEVTPSQGKHFLSNKSDINWSGQRGSNPRPSRWQRDALPLSYARL